MIVYPIYKTSEVKEMTLKEVKEARDKFEAFVKNYPCLTAWLEYGADANGEVFRVGVTDEGEGGLERMWLPRNQDIGGEGVDLSKAKPDMRFFYSKHSCENV